MFEGVDGSGKTTALAAVAGRLEADGVDVWATREETDTWRGEAVRKAIGEKAPPLAAAFLFLADRAAHVVEIEARLAAGTHVLCDRFLHSTLAYQSVALASAWPGGAARALAWLRAAHDPWCPSPDRVVLFDVPADVAMQRAKTRGARTNYERVEFLDKVAAAYRSLAAEDRTMHVVDASAQREEVAEAAYGIVQAALR